MKITKNDFERVISLAYQRGRVTPIRFIEKAEIDSCIADTYTLLSHIQQEEKCPVLSWCWEILRLIFTLTSKGNKL